MNPLFEALFAADHIANKGGMVTMPAPAVDGVKVSINDLAAKLLAYAFLSAKESGALDISIGSRKVLFITHKFVVIKRGSTPAQTESPLLNGLLQYAVDGNTVNDAVFKWFGDEQDNPYGIVVQNALQEAIGAGYMTPAEQGLGGKLAVMLIGALAKAQRVPEKTSEMESIRQIGVSRWDTWAAADRALMDEVIKQCASALSSRTKSRSLDSVADNYNN